MSPAHLQARAGLWRGALVGFACSSAVLCTLTFPPAPRLVWNASASAPLGLYRVYPNVLPARGDMVIAWAPKRYRRLAAERHYLPSNVPLVKRVAAVAGDRVCAAGGAILVDGSIVAHRLAADARGRPLPWWQGCRTLALGEYLLLTDAPASFDGRYFGISHADQLVGRARPLWTR